MKKITSKITIIFLFVTLLTNREVLSISVITALNIWINQLLPSLFPFFIFSDLFIASGIVDDLCKKIGPIFGKIFNVSKYSFFIFFISLASGCPTNAKNIKNMLDNGYIFKEEAEKILCFTLFFNPFLIYSIISLYLTHNDSIKIIIIIYLSNIIIGLLLRRKKVNINNLIKVSKNNQTLVDSIKNTTLALINILGTIITMCILINLLKTHNLIFNNILTGLLEITNGLIGLKDLNTAYTLKAILTIIYLSFGGLSIHMQIKSILKDTINYKLFYQTRVLIALIGLLLFFILHNLN